MYMWPNRFNFMEARLQAVDQSNQISQSEQRSLPEACLQNEQASHSAQDHWRPIEVYRSSASIRSYTEDTKKEERTIKLTTVWRHLPEELLEKIIAMLPFPCLFKARALSKSWLARLSSISSIDNEGNKRLAVSFQQQVGEWSTTWETFFPVCFGYETSFGYHEASESWQKLPSLSLLRKNLKGAVIKNLQIEGALLYGFIWSDIGGHVGYRVYVTNMLTQSCKQLPRFRNAVRMTDIVCMKLVYDTSSQTYKVILLSWEGGVHTARHAWLSRYYAQVYDSNLDAWTTKEFILEFTGPKLDRSTSAYSSGILYMMKNNNPQILLAYNMEKGTLEEVRLSLDVETEIDSEKIVSVHLLANCSLMVIIYRWYYHPVQVLKIDLRSGKLLHLAIGPPGSLRFEEINVWPVSDGCSIFFRQELYGHCGNYRVVAYNAKTNRWSSLLVPDDPVKRNRARQRALFICSAFQPGLNAFMEV